MKCIKLLNSYILSPVMFSVLIICFICLFIRLKGRPLITPKRVVHGLIGNDKRQRASSFRAMTLALAGTLGVGNIVGVATAIHSGGAGSVFWMVLSALAAMLIKYAEIVLALKFRKKDKDGYHGGAAYYIRDGIGKPRLAAFFSFLCIVASFTVGNMIQVNAVSQSVKSELNIPPFIIGLIIAVLVFAVIYKGVNRISDFTLALVPLLSLTFIFLSVAVILANITMIPSIIKIIIKDAFTPSSAASGVFGYLLMSSLRFGVIRGIGSNEAGCGTAPTAHATANTESPERQGYWGIFEVFVDTVIICTLTAFVILIYPQNIRECDGMLLAIRSFECFYGEAAGYILTGAVIFFAFSTVISWSYYAMESIRFFTKKDFYIKGYILVYCFFCLLGAVMTLDAVWELSDLTISLMTIINCLCVISLSKKHLKFE